MPGAALRNPTPSAFVSLTSGFTIDIFTFGKFEAAATRAAKNILFPQAKRNWLCDDELGGIGKACG